jgi:hypothetical protein
MSVQVCTAVEYHVGNGIDRLLWALLTVYETDAMTRVIDAGKFAWEKSGACLIEICAVKSFPSICAVCNMIAVFSPDYKLAGDGM